MENIWLWVHPSNVAPLLALASPKERWKMKHRAERMARKGKFEPFIPGELSEVVGFKFISGSM